MITKPSPNEFAALMSNANSRNEADAIVCKVLRSFGYEDGAAIYEAMIDEPKPAKRAKKAS